MRNRVFVVDASPLCRAGLIQLLRTDHSITVSGQAGCVSDALGLLEVDEPDLVLLGLSREGADALDQFISLCTGPPRRRIVLLVANVSTRWLRRALAEGAVGYLDKQCSLPQLLERIQAALREQAAVCVPLRLRGSAAPTHHRSIASTAPLVRDVALLTSREQAVLHQIACGLSNRAIAHELRVAEGTVKVHVKNVFKKLGVSSRASAAVWAGSIKHPERASNGNTQVLRQSDGLKVKPAQHPSKAGKHTKRGKEPSTRQPGLQAAVVSHKRAGPRRQPSGHK